VTAGAALATLGCVAALSACAGAPSHAPAAAVRAASCARATADLAAPGPYRVGSAHVALTRVGASGRSRSIDPTAWFPTATRSGGPVTCRSALILFSHGANGRATDYSRLLTHLAGEGFVVLAPHHPDRQQGGPGEASDRTDDMEYLLDHLGAIADRLAPGLAARIDTGRIGVAGHSFGGFTSADMAATDPRVRAALVMAGGERGPAAASIRVPVLAMAGGADHLIPVALVRAFVSRLAATTPHGLLVIGGAGHGAYGDGCTHGRTCGIVASYATSFFLTYLDGVRSADGLLDPHRHRAARLSLRTVGMPPR
jgi:predicted dienelactone hydrolase